MRCLATALLSTLIACSEPQPSSSSPSAPQAPKPVALDASAVDASVALDAAALDAATADARVLDAGAARVVRDAGTAARLAGHNEVCRSGSRGLEEAREVAACKPGLRCCYPCGIQGCAWVCHTPAECEADMRRP